MLQQSFRELDELLHSFVALLLVTSLANSIEEPKPLIQDHARSPLPPLPHLVNQLDLRIEYCPSFFRSINRSKTQCTFRWICLPMGPVELNYLPASAFDNLLFDVDVEISKLAHSLSCHSLTISGIAVHIHFFLLASLPLSTERCNSILILLLCLVLCLVLCVFECAD